MIELNGTQFFSKQEVCERMKMSVSTLNNKVSAQKIRGTRFGRYVYYTEQDMLNIIDPSGALYRALVEAARTTATQEAGAGLVKGEGEPESESPEARQTEEAQAPKKKKRKPRKKANAEPEAQTLAEAKKARQAWGEVAPDWGEITNDWGEVAPEWNMEQCKKQILCLLP